MRTQSERRRERERESLHKQRVQTLLFTPTWLLIGQLLFHCLGGRVFDWQLWSYWFEPLGGI